MTYEAGTYVKGDDVRTAKNSKQAVALVFDGFKLQKDENTKADAKPASVDAPEDAKAEDVTASSGDHKSYDF